MNPNKFCDRWNSLITRHQQARQKFPEFTHPNFFEWLAGKAEDKEGFNSLEELNAVLNLIVSEPD